MISPPFFASAKIPLHPFNKGEDSGFLLIAGMNSTKNNDSIQ
jgi:hypothetical protein